MGKVVVLGSSGQLGKSFCELLSASGRAFLAMNSDEVGPLHIDLSDLESLKFSLSGVEAVINCAAYTNVDGAEADEVSATQVNGEAVGVIAASCAEAGVPLVHFSTDYVFDGEAKSPYELDHPIAPLNAYGRSKARGEELLTQSGANHLLVRTSWVYAPWGNNFVLTMARLMKSKKELRVVDDQRGRPTHALGLAQRTLALLDAGHRGTFHITDGGECTWFGFAQAISDVLRPDCKLSACSTEEFPRPALRPKYSVLDTSRADELLGSPVHFTERLRQMQDALLNA